MTPAEKLGYKVGDEFEVLTDVCGFKKGQIVKLFKDYGSDCVCFEGSPCDFEFADGNPGALLCLGLVEPVDRITLRPGDHIATADLSEDDYHKVARAFMAAGANGSVVCGENYKVGKLFVMWDDSDNKIFHTDYANENGGRQLTLSQILSATNAGNSTHAETTTEPTAETTPMHLTDRLEAARITLESAQAEYDALLEDHKAAYPKLHGLSVQVDIPPEEWREGDVLECVSEEGHGCSVYHAGGEYDVKEIVEKPSRRVAYVLDDVGDNQGIINPAGFKFIRRP